MASRKYICQDCSSNAPKPKLLPNTSKLPIAKFINLNVKIDVVVVAIGKKNRPSLGFIHCRGASVHSAPRLITYPYRFSFNI